MFLFRFVSIFLTFLSVNLPSEGRAQQVVGYCHDQYRGQSFSVLDNFYMYQVNFPANGGLAMRDPSGMTFMRIPSADPWNLAFFVDWQGVVMQISPAGVMSIGFCEFIPGFMQPVAFRPPVPLDSWGVRTEAGVMALPEGVSAPAIRYVPPLFATPAEADTCLQSTSSEEDFVDCMLKDMLGRKEYAVYQCAQNGGTVEDISLCSIAANGGTVEREIVRNVQRCRRQHGDDWGSYPVCMMEDRMSEDQARLVQCLRKQSEQGTVTLTGTAVCYSGDAFKPNPELQIAMECAATTAGEPLAFASCTGGRLTERELTKCFTSGLGGQGCFGPNNEIIKGLRDLGLEIELEFGPSNDLVRAWNRGLNDMANGPGPNNDVVKGLTNVGNDIANGPGKNNDIVRGIDKVLPGFSDLF